MKLKALMFGTGLLLTMVVLGPARAGAIPLPPYQEVTRSIGNCGVKFGHGTYGGAYAYYRDIFNTCGSNTNVRIVARSGAFPVLTPKCGKYFPANLNCRHDNATKTYTTLVPGTGLVESRLQICTSNNNVCENVTFTL